MGLLWRMAFRNVFRNTRRSLLSMSTVIVGVFGMICVFSFARGLEDSFIRIDINTDFGHLRVMHKKYKADEANRPLELQVHKSKAIIAAVKQRWPSAIAFQRLIFAVDIGDGRHKLRCRGVALPPSAAEKAYGFSQLSQGKKQLEDDANSVYLGIELAKTFGKRAGDRLTLLVRTRQGSLNAIDFVIRDILATSNAMVDSNSVYMSLKAGRRLLQIPSGATDVIVRLPRPSLAIDAAALASQISPLNTTRTWQNKAQEIIELQKIDRQFYNLLILIIMLVAGIGIANALLMSSYERHGEIGMMMAQGMTNLGIVKMFAVEAGFLGGIGSFVGGSLGAAMAVYYNVHGLPIPAQIDLNSEVAMSIANTIYFAVDVPLMIGAVVLGISISVLGAMWPAWRLTRMSPLDVLAGR